MWVTNIKVRGLYRLSFGRDTPSFGLYHNGLHVCEAGNNSAPSLDIKGCPAVALTENHAATRAHVSLTTHCCSDAKVAAQAGGLPIDGQANAALKAFDVLGGVRMSSATTKHCR